MPRGSKDKYTDKQKRKAADIEASYKDKGVPSDVAQARAWATVNKQSGGGERPGGSGRSMSSAAKASAREDSAERAAATRKAQDPEALAAQSKQALLKQARAKQIHGRSTMDKQELIEALKKAS